MESLTEAERNIVDEFCRVLGLELRAIFEKRLAENTLSLPEVIPDQPVVGTYSQYYQRSNPKKEHKE